MTETYKEYASALFEIAQEENIVENVSEALTVILNEFAAAPEYVQLLSSPNIPINNRITLIQSAFCGHVPDRVLHFLTVLCKNGRIKELPQCIETYRTLNNEYSNVSEMHVISAVELTDEEKNVLTEKMKNEYARSLDVTYEINSEILGGLIIRIDGKIIDGSLRHKLKDVKEALKYERNFK